MVTRRENSLRRVLSRRDLVRGAAAGSVWLSVASVLLSAALLLLLTVSVDVVLDPERDVGGDPPAVGTSPLLVDRFVTFVRRQETLGDHPLVAMAWLLLISGVIAAVRFLLELRSDRLARRAARGVSARLHRGLHRQYLRLGPGGLDGQLLAEVRSLAVEDVPRVSQEVDAEIRSLGRDPGLVGGLLAVSLAVHWSLALECLLFPVTACWYLLYRDRLAGVETRQRWADRAAAGLRRLLLVLGAARVVSGMGAEDASREKLDERLADAEKSLVGIDRRREAGRAVRGLLVLLAITATLYLVARKAIPESSDDIASVPVSSAITLLVCLVGLSSTLVRLGNRLSARRAAATAATRVVEFIDRTPQVSQAVGAKFLYPLSESIRFEAVGYATADGVVLDEFDIELRAGEVTALLSLDRIQARAVAWMLPRFIEPLSGRVLFDGNDIAAATLESLRAEAIVVDGNDIGLVGTVAENLAGGHLELQLPQITAAAKEAHAHLFITRLAMGYETPLEDVLDQLDAGQRFRLGLARALARDPALIVIEEPDDPLDDDTKSLLNDAYDRIARDRTVLFLPSRLSTVRRADRVVLVDRGRVEAIGTHEELVRDCALYRHWEYLRFNEFRGRSSAAGGRSPVP